MDQTTQTERRVHFGPCEFFEPQPNEAFDDNSEANDDTVCLIHNDQDDDEDIKSQAVGGDTLSTEESQDNRDVLDDDFEFSDDDEMIGAAEANKPAYGSTCLDEEPPTQLEVRVTEERIFAEELRAMVAANEGAPGEDKNGDIEEVFKSDNLDSDKFVNDERPEDDRKASVESDILDDRDTGRNELRFWDRNCDCSDNSQSEIVVSTDNVLHFDLKTPSIEIESEHHNEASREGSSHETIGVDSIPGIDDKNFETTTFSVSDAFTQTLVVGLRD